MVLETGIIKGKKTSYTKSDGSKVVKYSKTINLGVNSAFDVGTNVVVMAESDYNNSNNNVESVTELTNTIAKHEATINNLTNTIAELKDDLQQSTSSNVVKADRIAELTTAVAEAEQQLTKYTTILGQYNITGADELNNLIAEFRIILNYLNDCINAYEKQGRIKRFFKVNPLSDIGKPTTKLIDYKGNKYANTSDEVEANKVNDSKE